jgi:hypothetical protein
VGSLTSHNPIGLQGLLLAIALLFNIYNNNNNNNNDNNNNNVNNEEEEVVIVMLTERWVQKHKCGRYMLKL